MEIYEGLLMLQHRGQDSGAWRLWRAGRPAWTAGRRPMRGRGADGGLHGCAWGPPSAWRLAAPRQFCTGMHAACIRCWCCHVLPALSACRAAPASPAPNRAASCPPPARSRPLLPPAAGMVSTDWRKFYEYKANGLVKDVFSQQSRLDTLKGGRRAAAPRVQCLRAGPGVGRLEVAGRDWQQRAPPADTRPPPGPAQKPSPHPPP